VTESFIIERRFRGPKASGNGGYTAGRVARFIDGDAEVTLRRPPPLERLLVVTHQGERILVHDSANLVAEAEPTHLEIEVPEPPSRAEAEAAVADYAGFSRHAFPECFVCGTARAPGDGLRLFPGWVPGRDLVAAPWEADPSLPATGGMVEPEISWAFLDCPGAWAMGRHLKGGPVVLGRMAAHLVRPIPMGAAGVAVGWPLGQEGRKLYSGTAVFGPDGALHGYARQTWIVVAEPQAA
jgi:hypothetical protein